MQRARQERMSRALGQAFLSHQVNELEKSVDALAFQRERDYPPLGGGHGGGGRRPVSPTPIGAPAYPRLATRRPPLQRRIVDASALIHGLAVLKAWVRDAECSILIPLEAIQTLDLLKKSTLPHMAALAREATRYLDAQLERNATATAGYVPRVLIQAEDAQASWAEVARSFITALAPSDPPSPVIPTDGADSAPSTPVVPEAEPTPDDVPRYVRPVIQCALYAATHAEDSPPPIVYVLRASPTSDPTDPAERANGVELREWAPAFGLGLLELPTEDIEAAQRAAREYHQRQAREGGSGVSPPRGGSVGGHRGRGHDDRGRGRGTRGRIEASSSEHGRGRGRALFVP